MTRFFVALDTKTMSGLQGGIDDMLSELKLSAQVHFQLPVLYGVQKP